MTHYSATNRKLSDADIERILTASEAWTDLALAARLGVSATVIQVHRQLRSKVAIRVARRLGLLVPITYDRRDIKPKPQQDRVAAIKMAMFG